MKKAISVCLVALAVAGLSPQMARADDQEVIEVGNENQQKSDSKPNQAARKVAPKPLTDNVKKGLEYLVKQQNDDGSWSQGEESQFMRAGGFKNGDLHNVADTCMAAMALVRAGNFPNKGTYASNVEKATDFVCSSIEQSDEDSLFITNVKGTRVQAKLGQYVDTFLASVFLPDVKGRMPTKKENERVANALNKVIHKIEKNQDKNGQWASAGWAPVHSQSLAMQGLNRAKQIGMKVDERSLERAEANAKRQFDSHSNKFSSAGAAGVDLYASGATIGSLQQAVVNGTRDRISYRKILTDSKASRSQLEEARAQLSRIDDTEKVQKQAVSAVTEKIKDKGFIAGFGCNGGEEFLSYMQISDTLLASNSKEWGDWDKKITSNINHVQNPDGSWMGQHCITSRTFCTAAALLTLMADRSAATQNIASKGDNDVN